MKNLKLYTCFLVVFALFFTSCSTEEQGLIAPENEKATLSFGALLKDLNVNRSELKQVVGDIPACSDDDVVYVEIILSSGGVDVVGTEGDPFRIDLVAGQLFTEEVAELELEPGDYTLEYFSVHSMDGTVIWVAPIAGSEMSPWVDYPLPLDISLGAGVKKYVDVSVLCYEDRLVNAYGYLFFQLDATQAIQFCIFGNYCDETGRHYPAEYSVNVWNYSDGQMGFVLYSGVTNTVELNDLGEYASSPVCFYLPDTSGDDEYYFQITLLNSDAYGDVTETVIREGVITDQDVRDLHIGEDDSNYYHLRYGCGSMDSPDLFGEPTTGTPPVIDRDTQIYIYFDSSGSMNSTLSPLQTMRNTILKEALIALYDNDDDLYDDRVQVVSRASERTFQFLNIEGAAPTGNVISLVFQDEAHAVYHGLGAGWDENSTRTSGFDADITEFRSRLANFPGNSYSGVIFQVENSIQAGLNYKNLIEYVQNGTGNYAGAFGLSDRSEVGFKYNVDDGNTPQYYLDLIIEALQDLGYQL
ncbi:hypothetical protein FHG64_03765 [Antarcticibacterium flavum]|uniref:VWA domain-containing protein n=1 Tax=Antarcticibacterium flavum TaxID=2058175 RepID=A0A5B7X015_9FLAO|nr:MULTISPECIES: hypothetical protein [Antarcticibacterium]MCM4158728.1 hypothetical protein [Antarcticibacterium sp. W02-3]QCY68580.1 hypothetical protein FHG64_03765 [Antarcticibacterium flavum]